MVRLIKADISSANEIWQMQKIAFADLLDKYEDYDTNPANEPLKKTVMRLSLPSTYYYFINLNGENIGAIRIVDNKSTVEKKRISPIFIMPQYRNNGYAQQAIRQAESIHGSHGWELDTILQETPLCRLYEKLGYIRTDKIEVINEKTSLVIYVK